MTAVQLLDMQLFLKRGFAPKPVTWEVVFESDAKQLRK